MSLRSPNLDNRRFADLVEEGRRHIAQSCREWTDLSPGDPGIVILEVFAYLTDILLYRLNRLPEKAYIEFLRLIGVRLHPPAAAGVHLHFRLARSQNRPVEIPKGTRVTIGRSDPGAEPPYL
jgi:predicted phage baseplate assembly protein